MNWLTKLLSGISLLILGTTNINPSATKNSNLIEFQTELEKTTMQVSQLRYYEYRNEIEFNLKLPSSQITKVIFNDTKSPLVQVSALQKIIKVANIKGKDPVLVDLSSAHPYATLKNN